MTPEEKKRKALSYIGFARRSGKIAVGAEQTMSAIRTAQGKATAVLSGDSSERTKKQIKDKCAYYKTPLVTLDLSGDDLARAAGKKMTVSTLAVTDASLASALAALCGEEEPDTQLKERIFPPESGNR